MANTIHNNYHSGARIPDSEALAPIVERLSPMILHAGYDCTPEMAVAIAKQYVRDHPEFSLAHHIHRLNFATSAHEFFREFLEDLDWTVALVEDGHPPFGWGQLTTDSDDIEFHVDFEIKGPIGEEHSMELTNGVWMNPFEIRGFTAPTLDE